MKPITELEDKYFVVKQEDLDDALENIEGASDFEG